MLDSLRAEHGDPERYTTRGRVIIARELICAARTKPSVMSEHMLAKFRAGPPSADSPYLREGALLATTDLESLQPFIEAELRELADAGAVSPAAALQQIFLALYGEAAAPEARLGFLRFAAPLAKRVAIELATAGERLNALGMAVADLESWWAWLDVFDPTTAKIVELRCFAALTFEETATATGLPVADVVQKLRAAAAAFRTRGGQTK